MTYTHHGKPPRTFNGTAPLVTERQGKIAEHQKVLQVFAARLLGVAAVCAFVGTMYYQTTTNTPSLTGDLGELKSEVAALPQSQAQPTKVSRAEAKASALKAAAAVLAAAVQMPDDGKVEVKAQEHGPMWTYSRQVAEHGCGSVAAASAADRAEICEHADEAGLGPAKACLACPTVAQLADAEKEIAETGGLRLAQSQKQAVPHLVVPAQWPIAIWEDDAAAAVAPGAARSPAIDSAGKVSVAGWRDPSNDVVNQLKEPALYAEQMLAQASSVVQQAETMKAQPAELATPMKQATVGVSAIELVSARKAQAQELTSARKAQQLQVEAKKAEYQRAKGTADGPRVAAELESMKTVLHTMKAGVAQQPQLAQPMKQLLHPHVSLVQSAEQELQQLLQQPAAAQPPPTRLQSAEEKLEQLLHHPELSQPMKQATPLQNAAEHLQELLRQPKAVERPPQPMKQGTRLQSAEWKLQQLLQQPELSHAMKRSTHPHRTMSDVRVLGAKAAQKARTHSKEIQSAAVSTPLAESMKQILRDPEIARALRKPKIAAAYAEFQANPMAAMKYLQDPDVAPVIQKLMAKKLMAKMAAAGVHAPPQLAQSQKQATATRLGDAVPAQWPIANWEDDAAAAVAPGAARSPAIDSAGKVSVGGWRDPSNDVVNQLKEPALYQEKYAEQQLQQLLAGAATVQQAESAKQQPPSSPMPMTLEGGLVKTILTAGDGTTFPKAGDSLSMHYTGTLAADGSKFDSSVDRGIPFDFTIGVGEVIRGWDVGVMRMSLGEKARLSIPSALGYGEQGAGGDIPPNADLVFEVELLADRGQR